jgi:hypothetical protein
VGLDPDKIQRLVGTHDTESLYIYVLSLYLRFRAEGFKRYPDLAA